MRGIQSIVAAVILLGAFAGTASAQSETEDPEANPGRPTVTTPATLTPPGYLQFETGISEANHSPESSTRFGLNETIKFSVARRLELIASGEPVVRSVSSGAAATQVADVFAGAQAVLYPGEGATPTVAVSYFYRVYDGGAPEFDYGSPTNSALILASADVKGFHYDANAMFTELVQEPVRRAQFGQSLSISHSLPWNFSVSGEIWHFTQPYLHGNAIGNLWAAGYTVNPRLVLDAGFNRGLTGTSTRWAAFAGFTYLLPHKLFGR
jgi:hypothetical protein